ncbi:phosphotransferase [Vibrio maerlii]|uniref:phosphotransferase n=1 Tax=Vibrio maerlii TaxID=2231648 RepID=UPI000E3BD943|nr:phosphotransferase [Vibrio maerlii]
MIHIGWQEAIQLDDSLLALTSFFSKPPKTVQLLSGGLTNRCWRVHGQNGTSYVWRPCSEHSRAFSVSRDQERAVLEFVTQSTVSSFVSPAPVFNCEQGLLVEWLEGETLHQGIDEASLIRLATDIHNLPIDKLPVAPFSYVARLDHYWFQIASQYKNSEFEAIYRYWRALPEMHSAQVALCHFDLGSYNLIQTDSAIGVIDWEYAAVSDPRIDLAMMVDLTNADLDAFVYHYCMQRNIEQVEEWQQDVEKWIPRVRVLAMLWFLLGYKLWGDAQYLDSANQIKHTICS